MPGKVIFVVTNYCGKLGKAGKKTGWYLPEVAHPYDALTKAGYEVTFVSPKGGIAPMDEGSAEMFQKDEVCIEFLKKDKPISELKNTLKASDITVSEYKALFYAGGHGPMFDLPKAEDIAQLAADVYTNGGVLAAVCHGTVGFLPIKLPNGDAFVKGQTVTSFTNTEEDAVGLTEEMPFKLEDQLRSLGANFVDKGDWQCNVQVCGRIVTGQNPQSATKVGEEMVNLLNKSK